MFKTFTSLILLISISLPLVSSATELSDQELSKRVIGTWVNDPQDSSFGNFGAISTYHEQGKLEFSGYTDPECTQLLVSVVGNWEVRNKQLFLSVTESSNLEIIPIGLTTVDSIIEISKKKKVLKSSSGEIMYRAKNKKCIDANNIKTAAG